MYEICRPVFNYFFLITFRLTCNLLCVDSTTRAYCPARQGMSDCFLHVRTFVPEGLRTNGIWMTTVSALTAAHVSTPTAAHLDAVQLSSRRHGVLRVKECMKLLELFNGNANKKADAVDAAELIAFNAWFCNNREPRHACMVVVAMGCRWRWCDNACSVADFFPDASLGIS